MTRRQECVGVGLLIAGLWVHPGVAWPLGWLGAHTGTLHSRYVERTCGAHARRDRPACSGDGFESKGWRGREEGLQSVGDWWGGLSQLGPPWRGRPWTAIPSPAATADRQQHDRGGLTLPGWDGSSHRGREGRWLGRGLDVCHDRTPQLEGCVSGGAGGQSDALKGMWGMWSLGGEKAGGVVPGRGPSERRAGGRVDHGDHVQHQQHVERWLSVGDVEGGAWRGRVRRRVMAQQLSPVAMTDMKEDPKPRSNNFTVNVGKAMDTLRVDVRLYFEREPELSIYTKDIVLRDDTRVYARGKTAYRVPFLALRTLTVFLPAAPVVDLLSLRWDEARQCIYVRFQVQIDTFWDTLYFDAVSLFRVNAQGLIYEHRIENVVRKDLMERPNVIVWRSMATRC